MAQQRRRRVPFGWLALGISAGCHLYLAIRLLIPLSGQLPLQVGVALVMGGLYSLGPLALPHAPRGSRVGYSRAIVGAFYFWLIIVLMTCALFGVRDLIWWSLHLFGNAVLPPGDLARAQWLNISNGALVGLVLCLALRGHYTARRTPPVRTTKLQIRGLDPRLAGLRIIHLTDIHLGPYTNGKWLAQVVARCNEQRPDLVAITGDIVDGPASTYAAEAAPFADLEAPLGVWFSPGNHDYYVRSTEWQPVLEGHGMKKVYNRHQNVIHNGASIAVAGITDPAARALLPEESPDLVAATPDIDSVDFAMLLSHRPLFARDAAEVGFNLQLSGHTHGGQIFPFGLAAHRDQGGLLAGDYQIGDLTLYVSRGCGFWGPAIRLLAPSEIAVLELVRG